MGKINLKLNEEIDKRFRKEVFKRKGMKKGNIKKAVEEALIMWINVEPKKNEADRK